ncbi:uncharacterized protein LOC131640949 isoform X2 [Vicia villosa]|uniref:uncharacterized protein LOC131640949 isoform X2 n=1 Tax=Vicia villosa TaxID=3911 RepID=UPI00273A97FF|nr:uncharacterized protein LOC131640949 isoform X2 [Vicia villosa]
MEKSPVPDSNASSTTSTPIGSRFSTLNKSFKVALRSMLTTSSKEEFVKEFPSFTKAEKDYLHRLYLQAMDSFHEAFQEEFEEICLKIKMGAVLDAVEEIVEEQELDPLFSKRSNIVDTVESLSVAKKNEIQHLKHMVQLGEENNQRLRNRLQVLKENSQLLSGVSHAIEKFKIMNSNYGANSSDEMHDA